MKLVASSLAESGRRPIPEELRGRRVLTRLLALAAERRAAGVEPTEVHLSKDDELVLATGAMVAFGPVAAEAARRGNHAFREFLSTWFRASDLELLFDADETDVR